MSNYQFSIIADKRFYLILILFWLLLVIFPWGVLYHFSLVEYFVDAMGALYPHIRYLPDDVRYDGIENSLVQLSVMHLAGTLLCLHISLFTKRMTSYVKVECLKNYFIGLVASAIWWISVWLFLVFWPGTLNEGYSTRWTFNNEYGFTFTLVIIWLSIVIFLSFFIGFLKNIYTVLKLKYST